MCRGKNHSERRCPADTSEARRKRREAKQAREAHIPRVAGRGSLVVPWDGLSTMPAMQAEAKELSEILHQPLTLSPDSPEQKAMDKNLEIRVTRLGLAMGQEIERRAGFTLEKYQSQRKTLVAKLEHAENELSAYWGKLGTAQRGEWKYLSEKDQQREYKKMERYRQRLAKKSWDLRDKETELTQSYSHRLSEASISVLEEIRQLGGEVAVHESTNPMAQKVIAETVAKHFPSAWIEASNEASPLVVSMSLDRAHYAPANTHVIHNSEGYPSKMACITGSEEELSDLVDIFSEENDPSIFIVDTPILEAGERFNLASMALRIPFNPAKDKMKLNGVPEGEGWKHGYYVTAEGISKDKVWYRHDYHTEKTVALANMVIPKDTFENSREKTTYHEFSHRAEDVMPHHIITRMEDSFLDRRTTTKAGVQEELTLIYRKMDEGFEPSLTDEVGRKGTFMSHYVGKYYPTSRSKEVLSTGAESLFGGAYGSFVGLNGYRKDLDHRGFVLGIFATA